jgi:hypothetical protein
VPQALADDECAFLSWQLAPRAAFATAGLLLVLLSGNVGQEPFIYFQF